MYLLSDLWRDGFASGVRSPRKDSEYWGLMQSMDGKRERIKVELSEEGQRALETFERTLQTLAELREEDTCIRAFRLGARMMLDLLGDYNGPFEN